MNGDYIIVGDSRNNFRTYLACVIGQDEQKAREILNRMSLNPTKEDSEMINGLKNLRIEYVDDENCWWNWDCD